MDSSERFGIFKEILVDHLSVNGFSPVTVSEKNGSITLGVKTKRVKVKDYTVNDVPSYHASFYSVKDDVITFMGQKTDGNPLAIVDTSVMFIKDSRRVSFNH